MRHFLLITLALPIFAQQEVILDLTQSTPIKAPTRVEPPVQLKVTVQNVNDFLYSYRGSIKLDPTQDVQLPPPTKGLTLAEAKLDPACSAVNDNAKKLKDGLKKSFRLEKGKDGSYPSIHLADSQAAWEEIKGAYVSLRDAPVLQQMKCPSWAEYHKSDETLAAGLAKTAEGKHEYPFDVTLPANGTATITIEEFYKTEPTSGGKRTFSFSTSSGQFFLSVGFLATAVQARSYDIVDVGVIKGTPAVPATGSTPAIPAVDDKTLKELRIQGTGKFRPAGMVLMNYKLPWKPFLSPHFGVALSAGTVYRAAQSGGNSTATNFGLFAGGSFHLWERLWITPGVHIGEFSDLPKGFRTANGLSVPDGYPSSFSGVNRWTTRFAIGITFRAADFKTATTLIAKPEAATTGSGKKTGAAPSSSSPTELEKAEALAKAREAQIAAQELFDTATKAVADAQEIVNAKAAATKAKSDAKDKVELELKTVTDNLQSAKPADQAVALKALQDAQAALATASVDLGKAQKEEDIAKKNLDDRTKKAQEAGDKLTEAKAKTKAATPQP